MTFAITEDMLRAYEEDRLDRAQRGIVAAHLLENPDTAAEVIERTLLYQAVSALGHDVLLDPVPDRLLDQVRRQLRARLAQCGPAPAQRQDQPPEDQPPEDKAPEDKAPEDQAPEDRPPGDGS